MVCREKTDKRQLTRVVYNDDVGVVVDPTGKLHGRGAYLCRKPTCWQKMAQGTVLDHALRTAISPEKKAELLDHYQTRLAIQTESVTGG